MNTYDNLLKVKQIYSQLKSSSFIEQFGMTSNTDIFNIPSFVNNLEPECKNKFLEWLTQNDIQNLEQINKLYATLNLIDEIIHKHPRRDIILQRNNHKNIINFISETSTSTIQKISTYITSYTTPEKIENPEQYFPTIIVSKSPSFIPVINTTPIPPPKYIRNSITNTRPMTNSIPKIPLRNNITNTRPMTNSIHKTPLRNSITNSTHSMPKTPISNRAMTNSTHSMPKTPLTNRAMTNNSNSRPKTNITNSKPVQTNINIAGNAMHKTSGITHNLIPKSGLVQKTENPQIINIEKLKKNFGEKVNPTPKREATVYRSLDQLKQVFGERK